MAVNTGPMPATRLCPLYLVSLAAAAAAEFHCRRNVAEESIECPCA